MDVVRTKRPSLCFVCRSSTYPLAAYGAVGWHLFMNAYTQHGTQYETHTRRSQVRAEHESFREVMLNPFTAGFRSRDVLFLFEPEINGGC